MPGSLKRDQAKKDAVKNGPRSSRKKKKKKKKKKKWTRKGRTAKTKAAPTSHHRPAARQLVKSGRDIMRKDKGLNGDLDRLPMLTWIMFLKFLDDMEQIARAGSASWPGRSSGRPSSRRTAGATGRPSKTASPATS